MSAKDWMEEKRKELLQLWMWKKWGDFFLLQERRETEKRKRITPREESSYGACPEKAEEILLTSTSGTMVITLPVGRNFFCAANMEASTDHLHEEIWKKRSTGAPFELEAVFRKIRWYPACTIGSHLRRDIDYKPLVQGTLRISQAIL